MNIIDDMVFKFQEFETRLFEINEHQRENLEISFHSKLTYKRDFPDLNILLVEVQRPLGLRAFKFTISYAVVVSVRLVYKLTQGIVTDLNSFHYKQALFLFYISDYQHNVNLLVYFASVSSSIGRLSEK